MATTTEKTEDKRVKVDHDEVVQLKKGGMSPKDIAEKFDVAIGTIYKILRDKGEGSGRTVGTSKGLNVASDLDSMIERLKTRATSVKEDLDAENERHKTAVATIKSEAEKAQAVIDQIQAVRDSVQSDNGSEAESKK